MFDVGANLGLLALPVLKVVPESTIISFEPSPNSIPWLRRTVAESGLGDRWRLVEMAVASAPGRANFSVSAPSNGLFDGLRHTQRAGQATQVQVDVTSLDHHWRALGRPPLSIIKLDVEGGELGVLHGSTECMAQSRPLVLLEWCLLNHAAYGTSSDAMFCFACQHGYRVYALPEIVPVTSRMDLRLQVTRTESFLMVPDEVSNTSIATND